MLICAVMDIISKHHILFVIKALSVKILHIYSDAVTLLLFGEFEFSHAFVDSVS